jgi:hypothetical protein
MEQCFISTQALDIQFKWQTLMDFKKQYNCLEYPPPISFESRVDQLKSHTKEFLEKFYQRIDYSPFLPSSSCMLISPTGTIHQRYHTAYRKAVTVPAIHQYLCSKHGWTPLILGDVNWQWFKKAVSLYRNASSNHLTKLIYNQLPTPDRLQKQGGKHWTSAICPHCQTNSQETFDHMLRCDHPAAIHFCMELPKIVNSHCIKYQAPSAVQHILSQSVDFALGATYSTPTTPTSSSALLDAQERIGWSSFLRGFLSQQWQRYLTDQITRRPKPTLRFDPDQFFY